MGKADNRLWDLRLNQLILFCHKNKRFVGASDSASAEEKKLYNWVREQIRAKKEKRLSTYRINRLNSFNELILDDSISSNERSLTKIITEHIKEDEATSTVINHDNLDKETIAELMKIGMKTNEEALAYLAWATLINSGYDDLPVTDEDKKQAKEVLRIMGIVNDDSKITLKSNLARSLASRLDSTFDVHSLYLFLAIMGPNAAWRIIFNNSNQNQMCARMLDTVLNNLPKRESEVIVCRYYKFKSMDDTADILRITKEDVKKLEGSAIRRLRSNNIEDYIINNIRDIRGEIMAGGELTNFEIVANNDKLRNMLK